MELSLQQRWQGRRSECIMWMRQPRMSSSSWRPRHLQQCQARSLPAAAHPACLDHRCCCQRMSLTWLLVAGQGLQLLISSMPALEPRKRGRPKGKKGFTGVPKPREAKGQQGLEEV